MPETGVLAEGRGAVHAHSDHACCRIVTAVTMCPPGRPHWGYLPATRRIA